MVALAILDFVLSSEPSSERSERLVGQLVDSALTDLKNIERLDEGLSSANPAQFDRATAALIRGLYDQWAREAEGLLDRISSFELRSRRVPGAEGLRDANGRIRAMLSVSLDHVEEARRQLAEGRTIPLAEVRRELTVALDSDAQLLTVSEVGSHQRLL